MNLSYYIYYRIPQENAECARAIVATIQRELLAATAIEGRLLSRRDDATTWMEIYENISDPVPFQAKLAELVERHGLARLLQAGTSRKQEIFRPI